MARRFYWGHGRNFGDKLTPIVFGHFLGTTIEAADIQEKGKYLGIGSVLNWALQEGDTVVGSGAITGQMIAAPQGVQFVAVRGPLTRSLISGAVVPFVYGDPALLLPLMYKPAVEKRYKV